jgi:hypothetical protein
MAKSILLDEFHLTVRAPPALPDPDYTAMRQALDDPAFQAQLRQAVRAVFRRWPALSKARFTLTR